VGSGRRESARRSAANYPGLPYFDTLDEALSLPGLDAVFLATPTSTHADLTCQALAAGCHVFCEKPLAVDPQTARRAVAAASERDLELFVGYVYLFHPAFDLLQEIAPPQDIRSLRFDWTRPHLGGELHEELLCHDLALAIALIGELPCRVAVLENTPTRLRCRIELPSGRTLHSSLRTSETGVRAKVVDLRCADGRGYTWRDNHVADAAAPDRNLLPATQDDALSREIAAFRAAVTGAGPRMVTDERLSIGIGQLLHDVGRSI
jgi:predicted dehydrogenase